MKPCPDGMKTYLIFDSNILFIQHTSTSGKTFAENSEYMNSATTYLSHQYSPRK